VIHASRAASAATSPGPRTAQGLVVGEYVPGVCNIGPAEIAPRRRTGVMMAIVTVVLAAALVVAHAPTLARVVVFIPAAIAASGFLQARLRFCAGFGWLGVINFRDVGTTESVASEDARRRDRLMATRIGLASAVVGMGVAVICLLLPT
jgi:hypothetical protein